MDINRMLNMHRAEDIMKLATETYKDLKPSPSVKFNSSILDLDISCLNHSDVEETVEIENIDTISATLKALDEGFKPLVLNMANHLQPGGGFLSGAEAQEEHLFRCTNYFRTLTEGLYPLKYNEVILSPTVHILKDEKYNNLDKPRSAAFLAVAAIQKPTLNKQKEFYKGDYHITKEKIRMIYQIGAIGKYDCLILGALGCGAFYNPPKEIAHIFCEVTSEYAQMFKKIVFAVKCSATNKNCDIFQRIFLNVFNGNDDGSDTDSIVEDSDSDPYDPRRQNIPETEHRLPYYIQNSIKSYRRDKSPVPFSLLFDAHQNDNVNYVCENDCNGCHICEPEELTSPRDTASDSEDLIAALFNTN